MNLWQSYILIPKGQNNNKKLSNENDIPIKYAIKQISTKICIRFKQRVPSRNMNLEKYEVMKSFTFHYQVVILYIVGNKVKARTLRVRIRG